MGNSLTSYFLSFGAQIILLRIIIISSLSSILMNIIFGVQSIIQGESEAGGILVGLSMIPVSVLLHHILRLQPRDKWSVKSDLIYSTIELAFVTGYLIAEILQIVTIGETYPEDGYKLSLILCAFILPFFCPSILASFVLTIWKLHLSQYRTISSAYNFTEDYDDVMIGWRRSKIEPWSLALGENIFRRRFGIDRMFIRGLRAGLSVLCLLGMITLAYLVLIIQPLQQQLYFQTMAVTHEDVRKYILDHQFLNVTVGVSLEIGRASEMDWQYHLPEKALDITWRHHGLQVPYDCHSTGTYYSIRCNIPSPFSPTAPKDLMIKINYTSLLQETSAPSLRTCVHVYLDDFASADPSPPIQIYPGFHLFGTTFYSFRDTYANSNNLAIGIPDFDRHSVANIQALIPDPKFANSNSDDTTATLRLTYQGDISTIQPTVIREQPSNTVLSGFALLGGIWTFINGLFAAIFGCSLLLVLFGIKPLSIYGLVHIFQRRRSLVDGGYTLSAEEQSRTIAVLREHLLDKEDGDMKSDERGEESNQHEERIQLHDIA